MNEINIPLLSARIKAYIDYEVNCCFDKEERLFIVEVFAVPNERRKQIRYTLYDLDSIIFPEGNIAISVIPYSVEDTKQYFPEIWAQISRKKCLDASAIKYENDGCCNSVPVTGKISLAA